MTKYILIAIFIVSSFFVFHYSRTVVSNDRETMPALQKVIGGIESIDGVVHRCSLNDITQVSQDKLMALINAAARETEEVLFHHIRKQVPSIEYKAYLPGTDTSDPLEITLLRDHEEGYGKTGEASQMLRDLIDDACAARNN